MKLLNKKVRIHDRNSKNVRPNRNESGFMNFVNDLVTYSDFPTQN
jgi:hypothetical protein